MSGGRQGVRSSRTDPITPLDRRQMRLLDRQIAMLDWAIYINKACRPKLSRQQTERRDCYDEQRKALRIWMKSCVKR